MTVRSRQRLALLLTALCSAPLSLAAQRATPPAAVVRWRTAIRADALIDRDAGAQLAFGVAVPAAYNVRVAVDIGVGGVHRPDQWRAAGRIDLLARLLTDPFRQSRWGVSAGGGAGIRFEDGGAARAVAIVTVGIEGTSDGRWVPGVEIGLGGGVRAGVTLRRAPDRRR